MKVVSAADPTMPRSRRGGQATKDGSDVNICDESFLENEDDEIECKPLLIGGEDPETGAKVQFSSFQISTPTATNKDKNGPNMTILKVIIVAAALMVSIFLAKTTTPTEAMGSETSLEEPSVKVHPISIQSLKSMLSPFIPDLAETDNVPVHDHSNAQQQALLWLVKNDDGLVQAQDSYCLLQRFVLAVLYISTNGDGWKLDDNDAKWQSSGPVCNWHGVTCEDRMVNVLDLSMINLTGGIPSEIGALTTLTGLRLNGNGISGNIPSEIGSLEVLRELYLGDNKLTGTIPSEIGSLTALTKINIWGNKLTGSIPSEIGSLTALRELFLWKNRLHGNIPSELWSLDSLTILSLAHNSLTGNIQSSIGSLTALKTLDLFKNNLTGTIPIEIGSLAALEQLSLGDNKLTGNMPSEIGSFVALRELLLHHNDIDGNIPSEIGSLEALEVMQLSDNNLTGEMPSELGALAALTQIYLENNELTGSVPEEFKDVLTHLSACNLGGRYGGNPGLKGIPLVCM